MDYESECRNAEQFAQDLRELKGIKVPLQYPELTSRRVLVSEWVVGEKLSETNAADLRGESRILSGDIWLI
jgi:aarF domain-containing kinase